MKELKSIYSNTFRQAQIPLKSSNNSITSSTKDKNKIVKHFFLFFKRNFTGKSSRFIIPVCSAFHRPRLPDETTEIENYFRVSDGKALSLRRWPALFLVGRRSALSFSVLRWFTWRSFIAKEPVTQQRHLQLAPRHLVTTFSRHLHSHTLNLRIRRVLNVLLSTDLYISHT